MRHHHSGLGAGSVSSGAACQLNLDSWRRVVVASAPSIASSGHAPRRPDPRQGLRCCLPFASRPGPRGAGAAPTARRARGERPAPPAPCRRPGVLGRAPSLLGTLGRRVGHREAGNGGPMAPDRLQVVLALDLSATPQAGPAARCCRDPRPHPEDGLRQRLGCAVGSPGWSPGAIRVCTFAPPRRRATRCRRRCGVRRPRPRSPSPCDGSPPGAVRRHRG